MQARLLVIINSKITTMIKTISQNDFINAFDQMGRNTHWSLQGLTALYDFLTECEDASNPMELDVIGLDCEFTEYKSALEAIKDYNVGIYESDEKDEDDAKEYFRDNTMLIEFEDGIIIQQF